MALVKIAFIDRDGVINECPGEEKYVCSVSQMKVHPFVRPALEKLKRAGFLVYVISNQACVGKGMITAEALRDITTYMLNEIEPDGKRLIDGVYYCTHTSADKCPCRKPAPGMINEALKKLGEDSRDMVYQPWFVGDTIRDMETAHNAHVRGLLVFTGRERSEDRDLWAYKPQAVARDLAEAVDYIISTP